MSDHYPFYGQTFPGQFEDTSDDNTYHNFQLYELDSLGISPVSLTDMKAYLNIANSLSDTLIQSLIDTCTDWGETYTARDFRANTYTLLIDDFATRIELRKNPTDSVTSIEYIVNSVFVVVDASIYYLKNGLQFSEILLNESKSWPTDGDTIEQAVKISFLTKAVDARKLQMATTAIKRHVAYMFENRGDCDSPNSCADAAGVKPLYDFLRIQRV